MIRRMLNIAIVIYVNFYVCVVYAADYPTNWPWRGVVVHSCCTEINEQDVKILAGYGVNAIVFNINARFQAEVTDIKPETAFYQSLNWIDKMLDLCLKYRIVGIIRLTKLPLDPKSGIREYSPEFWDNNKNIADTIKLIDVLSARYAGRGNELGAYAILTEPSYKKAGRIVEPHNWESFVTKMIGTIRRNDKTRHIVVTPGPGGLPSAYKNYKPISDPAIIYNIHMYIPYQYTHQGIGGRKDGVDYPGLVNLKYWDKNKLKREFNDIVSFQKKYSALLLVGEFGVVRYAKGADNYLEDLIEIFDNNKWSWTYFSYKANPLWDFRSKLDKFTGTSTIVQKAAKTNTFERQEILRNAWRKNTILLN